MDLTAYISSFPRSERTLLREQIAEFCGVTESAVRHWANGTREVPLTQALKIQELTNGKVCIIEIKPELKDAMKFSAA